MQEKKDELNAEIKDLGKEELIDIIIEIEWGMFTNVQNFGGRASCQDDSETFEIMRRSQFDAWNRFLLESYLEDLLGALSESRNLLTEKYAYMMKYSFPSEYEQIKEELPPISEEKEINIRKITDLHLEWRAEAKKEYPKIFGKGRIERIKDENMGEVSVESYTLGELATMSEKSLKLYLEYVNELKQKGANMAILILENTVKMYGYPSLEAAENN